MSVCLGQTVSGWGPGGGPQAPGRMRSAKDKKMARPRKSEPRDRQLNLSLTATELASIKRRAEALGMRPVHFGRSLLLDEGHKCSVAREPENNASRFIRNQLARLGNNLNQLLRHLHRTGDPLPADLEPLLNDIRRIIARVQS
jgi:Bacterial mobilisation protein (MobC)